MTHIRRRANLTYTYRILHSFMQLHNRQQPQARMPFHTDDTIHPIPCVLHYVIRQAFTYSQRVIHSVSRQLNKNKGSSCHPIIRHAHVSCPPASPCHPIIRHAHVYCCNRRCTYTHLLQRSPLMHTIHTPSCQHMARYVRTSSKPQGNTHICL